MHKKGIPLVKREMKVRPIFRWLSLGALPLAFLYANLTQPGEMGLAVSVISLYATAGALVTRLRWKSRNHMVVGAILGMFISFAGFFALIVIAVLFFPAHIGLGFWKSPIATVKALT